MFERGHKCAVTFQTLVPPAVLGRKSRRNKDFIDRCIKCDPWKSLCEGLGIFSKKPRPIRILKISDPIWNSEMTQIRDWSYAHFMKRVKSFVGKAPVISSRALVNAIIRRPVAQIGNGQLFD